MDVHFKSGQDVDVSWIFGPKMDVHRTFCAIWDEMEKPNYAPNFMGEIMMD